MQLCVRGKKQVGFAMLLLSLRLALLGRRERALTWWQLGAGGQGCVVRQPSILHLFHVSLWLSLAQSGAGGSRLTLEQGQGGKREAKQKKGGDEEAEGKGYLACLSGHMEPEARAGV